MPKTLYLSEISPHRIRPRLMQKEESTTLKTKKKIKMSKPIELYVYKFELNQALKAANATLLEVNEGLAMASKLLGKELSAKDAESLISEPHIMLTSQLTEGVKIEGMNLSASKILELKEINIEPVVALLNKAKKMASHLVFSNGQFVLSDGYKAELKERYTIWARTDEEIEAANAGLEFIASWHKIKTLFNLSTLNFYQLTRVMNGVISGTEMEPVVDIRIIKERANVRAEVEN